MTQNNVEVASATPTQASRKTTTPKSTQRPAASTSKAASVVALLSRPDGATIETLTNATGWQAHSVRGFLSGTVKKKLGKTVTSEKTEGGRIYRIVEASVA